MRKKGLQNATTLICNSDAYKGKIQWDWNRQGGKDQKKKQPQPGMREEILVGGGQHGKQSHKTWWNGSNGSHGKSKEFFARGEK